MNRTEKEKLHAGNRVDRHFCPAQLSIRQAKESLAVHPAR